MSSLRRALGSNIVPASALWFFCALLLSLYFLSASTREALDALAIIKSRMGIGFSMPAQAFCGGLLPFLLQRLQRGSHRKTRAAHLPFLLFCWAIMGALTDGFYNLQSQIFGNSTQLSTVLLKVVVDLGFYAPFISMPLLVLTFAIIDGDFNLKKIKQHLGPHPFQTRVLPLYQAALFVWGPTVAMLYALPLGLQFPFQAIVLCLWGLILVILTDEKATSNAIN